jgi:hypothetical protein
MKAVLWCAAAALLVLSIVNGLVLWKGSLEIFPTEEQLAKGRLAYGAVFVISAALLFVVVRRLRGALRKPSST